MRALAWAFADRRRYERGQRLMRAAARPLARGRGGAAAAGAAGRVDGDARRCPRRPPETFREWWARR